MEKVYGIIFLYQSTIAILVWWIIIIVNIYFLALLWSVEVQPHLNDPKWPPGPENFQWLYKGILGPPVIDPRGVI